MRKIAKVAAAVLLGAALVPVVGALAQTGTLEPEVAQAKDYNYVDSCEYYTVSVNGVKSGKVTYNKKTNTLTLKNTKIVLNGSKCTSGSAIETMEDKLTVVLKGKNTMKLTKAEVFNGCSLTLKGTGSLTVSGKNCGGISCGQHDDQYGARERNPKKCDIFTLSGPKVILKGPSRAGVCCTKMKVTKGSLTVSSPKGVGIDCGGQYCRRHGGTHDRSAGNLAITAGTVKVTNSSGLGVSVSGGNLTVGKKGKLVASGIDVEGGISVAGIVSATCKHNDAIECYGNMFVSGEVTATTSDNKSCGVRCRGNLAVSGTLTASATGANNLANGIDCGGNMSISGIVRASSVGNESSAIGCSGNVILYKAPMLSGKSWSIRCRGLVVPSGRTTSLTNVRCNALRVDGGASLSARHISGVEAIYGGGRVTVTNPDGVGIDANGLKISGCTVICRGNGGNGIEADDVSVFSGSVTCNGNDAIGIEARGGISIGTNATVTLKNNERAPYCCAGTFTNKGTLITN